MNWKCALRLALTSWAPNAWVFASRGSPGHDLVWDSHGSLVFAQVRPGDQGSTGHKELYPVDVSFDLQEMDAAGGVSMVFDKKQHRLRLEPGVLPAHALAWGKFDDRIATTGWSELSVETATLEEVSDDVKMYSAGFAEGILTCVRLSDFYANTHRLLMRREAGSHALSAVRELFRRKIALMKRKANINQHVLSEEPRSPYWKHARLVLFQLWGICDGYNFAARHFKVNTLGLEDMLLLNSGAELPLLMEAYAPAAVEQRALVAPAAASFLQRGGRLRSGRRSARSRGGASPTGRRAARAGGAVQTKGVGDPLDDAHWERRLSESARCSAFVRVADGNQDLFTGHTTWDDYSKMTRIFKYYKFDLKNVATAAKLIAFSSYPGTVSSTDHFYITDGGLVVMETSIEVLNPAIWDTILDVPDNPQLPKFIHVMITNRLATSAPDWIQRFTSLDTGISTSQWSVVDYNKFEVGLPVQDNTFWVLEVIPGVLQSRDMSYYLRDFRFWPSFNRPFFDEIREASGHAAAQHSHGLLYSWGDNPRAKIFAGAAGGINALIDMRVLMTRNAYPDAGVTPSGPGHEISARMDLNPSGPLPSGGIDAKVTGRCLVRSLQVQAVSGPSHSMQRPFRWRSRDGTELWPGWPHVGLPDVWNFSFVQLTPSGFGDVIDNSAC